MSRVLTYSRGSSVGFEVQLADANGAPIAGFDAPTSASFAMAEVVGDDPVLEKSSPDVTVDAATGVVSVDLQEEDTVDLLAGVYTCQVVLVINDKAHESELFVMNLEERVT